MSERLTKDVAWRIVELSSALFFVTCIAKFRISQIDAIAGHPQA